MEGLLCTILFVLFVGSQGKPNIHYETKFKDMPVDHFSFTNNDTFKLRYLVSRKHWKPNRGAPIFFYTGNEGDVTTFAENTGFMWEIAPEFDALLVFAEHRYYGESMPYGNKSYSDKKYAGYLSSSQALADYVDLIPQIKMDHGLPLDVNPVIAFGGSYGGMLAAWMRMKYPAIIAGSLAASAPIWQFAGLTPCNAFNRVVTSVFRSTSRPCYKAIMNSWSAIDKVTQTAEGKKWLGDAFKTCRPLKNAEDMDDLRNWLSGVYSYLAMANYPYQANFVADLPGHPVKAMCARLKNAGHLNGKPLLKKLFEAVNIFFNRTGSARCLDIEQGSSPNIDEKGWDYQSCTEMVMPMCDDGPADMMEKQEWNFTKYSDDCFNKYGVRPDEMLVQRLYGGKSIETASNIIFSNGLLDPWSAGGVLKNVSSSLEAVVMKGAAHHLDLRSSHPRDPPSVRAARKHYVKAIKEWIRDFRKRESLSVTSSS